MSNSLKYFDPNGNFGSINQDGRINGSFRDTASSVSSQAQEERKKEFSLDTMGGDASLLHLISLIDRGISNRNRFKGGESAKMYHKIYKWCEPFKFILIGLYILLTQFEQPAFCLQKIHDNEKDFDGSICNNASDKYTNWAGIPKFSPSVTRPVEISCLLILLVIQALRN